MPAPDATGNGAEFPTDWQVVRLDAVADLLSGGTPSKSRARQPKPPERLWEDLCFDAQQAASSSESDPSAAIA